MSDDFKTRLFSHAQVCLDRAPRATSEAATQQYLILPFFQILGYDPLNPDEIVPEASASFSDKFKNRVDYAIHKDGDPVIAVECKCAGRLVEANRGELKGYFNAVPSVKLGILTDGLIYELYSDTGRENMMDDEPFIRLDLSHVAKEQIADDAFDALVKLRKGTFDPADVGADARRKLYVAGYVQALEQNYKSPDETLVKAFLDLAGVDGRRTARLIEEHTPIVAEALQAFLDKKILERVGFANRQDIVRMRPTDEEKSVDSVAADMNGDAPDPGLEKGESGIITTETELAVFQYVKTRLSFLVGDEALFDRLDEVRWMDFKTVFAVYYRQQRTGRLFNFREGSSSPRYRFEFPEGIGIVETDSLRDIDEHLLRIYRKRVEDLG